MILVFVTQFNSEMDKREFCYAYIQNDLCMCHDNPELLLNKSLKIDPFGSGNYQCDMAGCHKVSPGLNESMEEIIKRIESSNYDIKIK